MPPTPSAPQGVQPHFSSTLLDNAVASLAKLPGIGRKTALRLALHILRRDAAEGVALGQAIIDMRRGIRYCRVCHNISETDLCPLCANPSRDPSLICVVETVKDVMSIEATHRFNGLYHVLGGVISPMDGIGPDELETASLMQRVTATARPVREIILALGATMEGETTSLYLYRRLRALAPALEVTQLARGVAVGNELEYTDEITLGRSIDNRTPFTGF